MTRFIVEGLSNVIRIRVPYQLLLTSLLRFSRFFYIKRASKSYNRNTRLNTHSTISLPWLVSGWNKWKGHFKRGDHAIKRFDFRERQTSAASYGGSGNENKPRREDGEGWMRKKKRKHRERIHRPVGSVGHCWGGCLVRRPSSEGATVFPLWHTSPFRSRSLLHRHLCPFLLSERKRGTFPWWREGGGGRGLARDCHSVMDDSTPTRSIRLPRACTCLGGETHPSCSFPSPCRESRRFRPI